MFKLLFLLISLFFPYSSSSLHPLVVDSEKLHLNSTAISDFRLLNRRSLISCPINLNPYIKLEVISKSKNSLLDEEFINVVVTGVSIPSIDHWVALITPSNANVDGCPENKALYLQTGDLSSLPLLCHYPVKAVYLRSDPDYLRCKKRECKKRVGNNCVIQTCNATVSFHVINFRTDVEVAMFGGGFTSPCLYLRSHPLPFLNPNAPLYGHLSSLDSTATSMRLSWVSGNKNPQQVQYGKDGTIKKTSLVSTFSQNDMCDTPLIQSPAKDFGWHDPGFIHSAVMTQLQPSTTYSYRYGSDSVGWSNQTTFRTPPAGGGGNDFHFIAFGDMGKAPLDSSSVEHYIQPGSISVVEAMKEEVERGEIDGVFHIGDISYATGFLVEWDFFLHLINPIASRLPYMTAIGNHERDYVKSGSVYSLTDSGGECGVPYETYFQMPNNGKDKPWYSIEMASIHFTIISTEHNFSINSPQYEWMKSDMASVNRSRTPWLIFMGHRPMYSSIRGLPTSVDHNFVDEVEPLPLQYKVERWSLVRVKKFGYLRGHATMEELSLEMVNADTREVEDSFKIIKSSNSTPN
ncbi:probable inactive purple acid phosphatase 27 isoform X2 [Cucumis melo]|uniref:Purple acid phosphatase n=1 Tax=Cucumis melo TaxID=3656 RepID=A0ABM3L8C0_CUCME|nr:probable inactive purple acid phosphatase 27 isoform X2 [Cucumis melo]